MVIAIFIMAVVIYAASAAQDLRERKVSNYFCAGIAILGMLRWLSFMQIWPAAWAVGAALILFAVGTVFFSRGWLGGGDVKLIAATALLIGGTDTPAFLLLMSLIGSALALVLVIYVRFGRFFRLGQPEIGLSKSNTGSIAEGDRYRVPYGVAVAVAASVVVFIQIQGA